MCLSLKLTAVCKAIHIHRRSFTKVTGQFVCCWSYAMNHILNAISIQFAYLLPQNAIFPSIQTPSARECSSVFRGITTSSGTFAYLCNPAYNLIIASPTHTHTRRRTPAVTTYSCHVQPYRTYADFSSPVSPRHGERMFLHTAAAKYPRRRRSTRRKIFPPAREKPTAIAEK